MTPSRRDVLRGLGATLALGAAGLRPGRSRAGAERPPNLVLILADDLGQECLASYGGSSYRTPHLDALAASGMRFSHCFSTPLCSPSRLELMTGVYPLRNYRGWGSLDPSKETTFAQVLRDAGYATCVAGKWQFCRFDDPANADHPQRSGFDESCLWTWLFEGSERRYASKYWSPMVWQNGKLREDTEGRYAPDVYCDYLLGFIERQRERPFLAYLPMVLPHEPYEPTPHSSLWMQALARAPMRVQKRFDSVFFADYLEYLDFLVGRIVATLDRLGLRENTLILFSADNGTGATVRSRVGDHVVAGGKDQLNEPGTRVPLIADWKGRIAPGSVCDDLVDLSDFFPTLAAAGGTHPPAGAARDGRSFLPQLLGRPGTPREWVYICHWKLPADHAYQRAVRTHRWKLVGDGHLYDMLRDPWEQHAFLPGREPEEAARVRARLQAVIDAVEEGEEPWIGGVDPNPVEGRAGSGAA